MLFVNKSVKNFNILSIITAFLLFNVLVLPVVDNLSGILFKLKILGDSSIGSPSQLGRLVAFVFILYLIFFYLESNSKRLVSIVILYFLSIEWFAALLHLQLLPFLYGAIVSSKIIYTALCAILFVELAKQKLLTHQAFTYWFIFYGTVISLLVLIAYISGFHISNYSKGIATRGLFISGNGLGVVLGSCVLVLIHNIKSFSLFNVCHILLLLLTTALIGTKGALIFLLCGLLYFQLKVIKKHPFISILLVSVVIYSTYDIISTFVSLIFQNIIFKFQSIDDKWLLLASSRDLFIKNAFDVVEWESLYSFRFLFGVGAYFGYLDPFDNVNNLRKLLENDLFELFFSYGILSAIAYIIVYFWGLLICVRFKLFFYAGLLSLVFLHSITAGHVVFNGTSSIVLAFVIGLIKSAEISSIHKKNQCNR